MLNYTEEDRCNVCRRVILLVETKHKALGGEHVYAWHTCSVECARIASANETIMQLVNAIQQRPT